MRQLLALALLTAPLCLATIEWKTTTTNKGAELTCVGHNTTGYWAQVYNATDHLIGTVIRTNVTMTAFGISKNFSVSARVSSNNSGMAITLIVPQNTTGTFKCTIGNATQLLYVKKAVTVSASVSSTPLGMQILQMYCSFGTNETEQLLWFLNSTLCASVTVFPNRTEVVNYKNTTFISEGNFTHNNGVGSYFGGYPACLTCVVSQNETYGDSTHCTFGARNIYTTSDRSASFEEIQKSTHYARLTGNTGTGPAPEHPPTGTSLIVITVVCIAAVAGAVFLIHYMGKRMRVTYSADDAAARVYRRTGAIEN